MTQDEFPKILDKQIQSIVARKFIVYITLILLILHAYD